MKKIYIVGGTMGVGKTTTCQILKRKLENSVFLDGDWCWAMDPFIVNDETKNMVMDNITYLLNNFIKCSVYNNIVFCWVMHEQDIIDDLISRLHADGCEVRVISLTCSKEALEQRLGKDVALGIRTEDVIKRSTERLHLYNRLNTGKIDVSKVSPEEAANMIINKYE